MKTIASITNVTTNTARNELDSHADRCALGSNFIILHYTGRVCDVAPSRSSVALRVFYRRRSTVPYPIRIDTVQLSVPSNLRCIVFLKL